MITSMRIAGATRTGRYAGPRPAPLSAIVSPPGSSGPDGRCAAGGTPVMTDAPCAAAADSPPPRSRLAGLLGLGLRRLGSRRAAALPDVVGACRRLPRGAGAGKYLARPVTGPKQVSFGNEVRGRAEHRSRGLPAGAR